jgi:hypothetical protein
MSIKNLSRFDNVKCNVLYSNSKGSVLSIDGLIEQPYAILYDAVLEKGAMILGSVSKISDDGGYIRVKLDSVLYGSSTAA